MVTSPTRKSTTLVGGRADNWAWGPLVRVSQARSDTTSCSPWRLPAGMSGTTPSPMTIEHPGPGGVHHAGTVADDGVVINGEAELCVVEGLRPVDVGDGDDDHFKRP